LRDQVTVVFWAKARPSDRGLRDQVTVDNSEASTAWARSLA
jgi:hypothetical protein